MPYNRFRSAWKNRPDTSTPITAEALDHFEEGVKAAHDALDGRLSNATLNATYVRPVDADAAYAPKGAGNVARFGRTDAKVVTNFDAGHGWTIQAAGGGTSNLNDTADFAFGTQSIRLTTGGAGASVIVQNLAFPAIPADRMFRLWVKIDNPDTINRIRLFAASDAGFANYYSLETYISSASIPELQRPFKAGEWVPIALPWSTATVTGTPDRNNLTALRILINDRNTVATIRLGRIEHVPYPVPLFPNGVVSLTYDDSFAAHYTVARPHLDKYGYAGVLFPILDRLDQPGYLTTAQVDRLAFIHGWEIGAHATTYDRHVQSVTAMTSAERVAEFRALRAWQQSRGYTASTFAYPNGNVTAPVDPDLRQFFGVGRLALGRFSATGADEMQNPSMPTRIYAQNCGNLTVAQVTAEIDRAIANKTWLVLLFHNLPTTKADANDFAAADHAAVIDYLNTSGIAVRTMDQVRQASL